MNKKIQKIINKKNKSKIVSLTAYSRNIAKILDKHCDIVLVGDSMANVLYGLTETHKIDLENINDAQGFCTEIDNREFHIQIDKRLQGDGLGRW